MGGVPGEFAQPRSHLFNGNLSSYTCTMPRRKAGTLIPIELAILEHGIAAESFYGFALARSIADGAPTLTAHGTLYKALARMTESGLLDAEWEDHAPAEAEGRPRRRLYRVTGEGARALAAAQVAAPLATPKVSLA